ncbi:MAG TPA: phosphoribosylformylglycinamidine cyclo-ligase [Candidatus Olsenella avistercoris]|nr:phosphoribosylformylglycinamidine cyclo-ligase [Candidatus Olsenella avistercoris]
MAEKPSTKHVSYEDAGVDTAEGLRAVDAIKAAVATTNRPEVIGGLGGFGSCFSAAALKGMEEPILVSGTDGVGTKLAIAQLLDRHETVGEDLVAMCVDDIVPMGAEPLFFLDYVAIGKLRAEHVAKIVGGIAEGCRKSGCALVGGEMAEHPGVMAEDDYDLAGFVVGVVDRPKMIGPELVREGDVILGLPSSGVHSNGYSLVRKVAIEGRTVEELETPLDELGGESVADAVMRPTTIYAGGLLAALRAGAPIHAMAHITGGGITENLDRAMPEGLDALVYRGGEDGPAWSVPPVISYLVREAGLTLEEAYRTFNMGVGMAVICAPEDEATVRSALEEQGFEPFTVGRVVAGTPGEKGKVVYDDER